MKRSRTSSAEPERTSPFEGQLGSERAKLAEPLAIQFFGADADHRVCLDGIMRHIWHRHRWLKPFFALLAWADIFFPETGNDIPASMIITQAPNGVAWRRTFWFPRVRRFNAVMASGVDTVLERVGPAGVLEIPWILRLRKRDLIEITTGRLMLHIGRVRLAVPAPMQVVVRVLERAVDGSVHVDLVLRHRLLGPVFGYEGTFRVRREPIDACRDDSS